MTKLQTITASQINSLHDELVGMLTNSLHKAAEIGYLLTEKKQQLRHGEFTSWVNSNLTFTDRTARNYMRLHENRHKITGANNISDAYKMLEPPKTETVSEMDSDIKLISIDDVVCKKEYHARTVTGVNYDIVQKMLTNIGSLPPIEINQHNILIDGWHRLETYKLAGRQYIPYTTIITQSDGEILTLSASKNAKHGLPLDRTSTPDQTRPMSDNEMRLCAILDGMQEGDVVSGFTGGVGEAEAVHIIKSGEDSFDHRFMFCRENEFGKSSNNGFSWLNSGAPLDVHTLLAYLRFRADKFNYFDMEKITWVFPGIKIKRATKKTHTQ